jgi:hypothetical protein
MKVDVYVGLILLQEFANPPHKINVHGACVVATFVVYGRTNIDTPIKQLGMSTGFPKPKFCFDTISISHSPSGRDVDREDSPMSL